MIIRFVLLFIIVAIVIWLLKRLFASDPEVAEIKPPTENIGENMLKCQFCGIHVPESSIINIEGNQYCCQDHARRDQQ